MIDVLERNYAGHIEDRRTLAISASSAVGWWRPPAGADKTTDFAWAKDPLNAIAFTRKDTIGRSISSCDTAATVHPFCDSKCAWPIDDSGSGAGFRINRVTRFAGQPDSPEY